MDTKITLAQNWPKAAISSWHIPFNKKKGLALYESCVFPMFCLLFKNLLFTLGNRRMQNRVTLQSCNEVDT